MILPVAIKRYVLYNFHQHWPEILLIALFWKENMKGYGDNVKTLSISFYTAKNEPLVAVWDFETLRFIRINVIYQNKPFDINI